MKQNIEKYIKSFRKLSETVEADTGRRLIFSNFGQPSDPAKLDVIQKNYFSGRESGIIDFYRQVNGIQIFWNYASNISTETDLRPLTFLYRNVAFDGVINLLPIEIAFDPLIWKDTIWFDADSQREMTFLNEKVRNDQIKKKLIPFDFFSVDMSIAIYNNPQTEYLLLLQDYHIGYDNSYVTYFEDYLRFLIATEGKMQARYPAFNMLSGYKSPPRTFEELVTVSGTS